MLNTAKLYFQQKNATKLRLILVFVLGISAPTGHAESVNPQQAEVSKEISNIIAAKEHAYLKLSSFANRSEDLDSLYKLADYQLLWLGTDQSQKNIAAALDLLTNASVHGLNPVNYDVEGLKSRFQAVQASYKDQAMFDTALSISLLRFMHDLHYGRVNPQGINFNLKLREKKLADLPVLIKANLAQGTVDQLPKLLEPQLQQYQKLKQALADYRQLAATAVPFQFVSKDSLRPGNKHPQMAELRQFLLTVGDLTEAKTPASAEKSTIYSEPIVGGVKKFQLRHGLGADGVIGKTTVAALNVSLAERVTQIELAMERLRWLPELSVGKSIIVNIPAFQLWAFDDIGQPDATVTNMRVVVGKALENQTPVLMAEMRFIDFMPYWNVPYSIAKQEIIPKLLQNPNYLAKENMELVPVFGNEVQGLGFNGGAMEQIKQGALRIRQRPGGKNALGRVKFIFPNKDDVYLHDTPSNSLFSRSRRDFSHGCVRVENPQLLAEFALKNQSGWDKELIQQALKTPKTQRVILKQPIPVLFFYTTSFFDHDDNLRFYSDIYGHDSLLLEALSKPEDLSDQALFISNNAEQSQQPALVK